VIDFGTPVSTVLTQSQGGNVRMTVTPRGQWEHNAYQSDNQFVLEVKPVKEDPNKLTQGVGKGRFGGEKLSLNFQNIDVRSVLQVIADFTNFNIITSDSVQGNLTLRLKDVPWDQALDIILQARGLDMRKNGNVIWIAPRDELAAREKLDLEAKAQIGDLEPLRTETFQINYHKAKSVAEFIKGKEQTVLSKRGNVSADERSNKLFVNDVPSRLEDVRRLIAEIDVEVRQVLIEAQIVEATDTFARNLGVRLGFGGKTGGLLGTTTGGVPVYRNTFGTGNLNSTAYQAGRSPPCRPSTAPSVSICRPPTSTPSRSARCPSPSGTAPPRATSTSKCRPSKPTAAARWCPAPRDDRRQGRSHHRAGLRNPLPDPDQRHRGGHRQLQEGQPVPQGEAPDHPGRQGHDGPRRQQGPAPLRPAGRRRQRPHRHQARQDRRGRRERWYRRDRRHLHPGSRQQHHQDPLLGDIPVLGYLFRNNERKDNKTELLVFITPRIINDQLGLR
jgi:type IV pilus assembly protein PilQ